MFEIFKPNFPKMKKFDGEWYSLESVDRDREKIERRGRDLKRRGYVMAGTVEDYQTLSRDFKGNMWYALYVK